MVMPMNVKEFDNFGDSWPFFVQISSKIVSFGFSSKMQNFTISFVFYPKRISCVPMDMYAVELYWCREQLLVHVVVAES